MSGSAEDQWTPVIGDAISSQRKAFWLDLSVSEAEPALLCRSRQPPPPFQTQSLLPYPHFRSCAPFNIQNHLYLGWLRGFIIPKEQLFCGLLVF